MEEIELFQLVVYNDLLEAELCETPIEKILDNDLKCKLKNAVKATRALTQKFDEMFKSQQQDADYFGDLAERIKKGIDNFLKEENND